MVDGKRARRDDDLRRHHERPAGRLRGARTRSPRRCSRARASRSAPAPVPAEPGATVLRPMAKTLVIAEKPSVGRDLTRVLPGSFTKQEGYLESDDHVVTWAVGHLVQLAEPDEYDPKFKKWKMADLPIVPDRFKLVVRDERSRKQMTVITRNLGRDDIGDGRQRVRRRARGRADLRLAVREVEREEARAAAVAVVDDPERDQAGVRRAAPGRRVPHARGGGALALRGRLDRGHERHARGDDPAALVVRRRRVARPRADADARHPRPPRGRDPRVQAGEVLAGRRDLRAHRGRARPQVHRPLPRGREAADRAAPRRPRRSSPPCAARPARSPSSRRRRRRSARRSSTT